MKCKLKSYAYLKIQLLLFVILCGFIVFNQEVDVKAAEEISPKIISNPGEIEGLIAKDEGVIFNHKSLEQQVDYESFYSLDIHERGWFIIEKYTKNSYYTWKDNVDIYANPSMTKK